MANWSALPLNKTLRRNGWEFLICHPFSCCRHAGLYATTHAMFTIESVTQDDVAHVQGFIAQEWGAPEVVVHDTVYEPHTLPGFAVVQHDEWLGLITYHVAGNACEIVTLDSLRAGVGVGTALIEAVAGQARRLGCTRVWLIVTNDNGHALRFYQKRGFRLVAVHRDAVDRARHIKPSIPLVGNDGIPIHDEIELELIV